MRGIVEVEFTEFSYGLEVGDWGRGGRGGVTAISPEVSCLERSWALELGRVEFES